MFPSGYAAVIVLIGVFLGILAFALSESVKGRVVTVAIAALLFFLPKVWHDKAAYYVTYIGWVVFGLGCYIFVKWRRMGPF